MHYRNKGKGLLCPEMAFLAGIALVGVLPGCSDQSSGTAQQSPQTAAETAPRAVPRKPWPPAPQDSATIQLSGNELAKNYYLILDGSGSMNEAGCSNFRRKFDVAREAVAAFSKALPVNVNLGLAVFDSRGLSERLPLSDRTRSQLEGYVARLRADSGTPLYDAVQLGQRALTQQAQKQLGYGEYHLVIVTDGEASSGQDPRSAVNWIAENTPIIIHTIGFCIGEGHSLNQPGRTLYKAANNPAELRQGLLDVLAESPTFTADTF